MGGWVDGWIGGWVDRWMGDETEFSTYLSIFSMDGWMEE